ncbi:TPA: hypothetical protein ACKQOS_001025 [Streptococcus pyogenes]
MAEETQVVETVEEQVVPEAKQPQDEKKYTDADVDAIIDKKFAKWKSEQEAEKSEAKKIHVYGELKKRSRIDDIVASIHDKIICLTSAYDYNIQIDRINERTSPDNSDTTPLLHTVLDVYLTYTKKENKWLN